MIADAMWDHGFDQTNLEVAKIRFEYSAWWCDEPIRGPGF